ncbi:MAG: MFS transporter [Chloroflexota bacterium]
MIAKFKITYNDFPKNFWIIILSTFIDRLGGSMIFPFFAIFVSTKFGVGMTQVGILFSIFALSNVIGSFLGGAMTDRYGRKFMIIFGLVVSAVSSILLALVPEFEQFAWVSAITGLLSNTGGPARQAMMADVLPKEKRVEGFGIMRVVINLAVALGPMIGGLLATTALSYLLLFILDAITSIITAVIVYFKLPETKPEPQKAIGSEEPPVEGIMDTFKGYFKVGNDKPFIAFVLIGALVNIVYFQMYSSLPFFMHNIKEMSAQSYGYILSMNAFMFVFLQFWFTKKIKTYPSMLVMAAGAVFYMVGFTMFGFVGGLALFALAMAIITIGEMLISPVAQAMIVQFAPEDMRGRYMAVFGLSFMLPNIFGSLVAGLVMDNFNPSWVWWSGGMITFVAVMGYLALHFRKIERLQIEQTPATAVPSES